MAGEQQKQIKFVGTFKDNITPTIKKINKSVNLLNGSMRKLYRTTMSVSGAFRQIDNSVEVSVRNLRQYRSEVIKAGRSYNRFQRAASKGIPSQNIPPSRSSPTSSNNGGKEGPTFGSMLKAEVWGGVITNAISAGFNYGTNLIRNTFNMVFGALQERAQDQMSDIQSAGGIFALSQRKGIEAFGRTFDDALGFQRELNAELAKAAGALPGSTSDYVQTAKGLTDGLMTTIGKDAENFKQAFGDGTGDLKNAMTDALTQLTTKGVLLGQGQQGGIPLPVLLERILSQDKVNVQSMASTFAALEQNPLLKGALEEAEDAINASGANTAERLKVLLEALDNALPAEQINAMKRATLGVVEAYRSFFKDPESGLFGLGRAINFGTSQITEYSSSTGLKTGMGDSISLFETLNDIFANIAVVFSELLPVIYEIWDPLKGITGLFLEFRDASFSLFAKFNGASNLVKAVAKKYGIEIDGFQAGIRSAIIAITQWLREVGAIGDDMVRSIGNVALGREALSGEKLKEIVTFLGKSFLNSDWLKGLAESLGRAAAKVIVGIRDLITGVSTMAQDNTALGALFAGFRDEGGGQAIKDIFSTLFQGIVNFAIGQIKEMFANDPWGTTMTLATIFTVLNPDTVLGWLFGAIGKLFTIGGEKSIASALTGRLLPYLGTLATGLGNWILATAAAIPGAAALGIAAIVAAVAVVFHYLKEPFLKITYFIQNGFNNLYSMMPGWLQAILNPLKMLLFDIPMGVIDVAINTLAALGKFIVGVLTLNGDTIMESFSDFGYIFVDMWGSLQNFIIDKFGWLLEKFGVEMEYYDKKSEREARKARRRNDKALRDAYNMDMVPGALGNETKVNTNGMETTPQVVKGPMSVTLTSGKQLTIPAAALQGQGSMNLTTMLPLLKNLGKAINPNNPLTGLPQGERQLWGGSHDPNSNHYKYSGIDIGHRTTAPADLEKLFEWLYSNLGGHQEGGVLDELFYDPMGKYISGGKKKDGAIGGHMDHLHIGWKPGANLPPALLNLQSSNYRGNLAPLMQEARNMPSGARLAVANTSEAVLTREQVRGMFEGIAGGSGVVIQNMVVNGNNAKQLAEQVVAEIDKAVQNRRKRSALA